jgi:hypothetical protein
VSTFPAGETHGITSFTHLHQKFFVVDRAFKSFPSMNTIQGQLQAIKAGVAAYSIAA